METEGIVLKSRDIGDRLRHLSVYTEKLGKLNLIVRVRLKDFPIKYEPFSVTLFKVVQKGNRWEVLRGKLIEENFPKCEGELLYRSKIAKLLSPLDLAPSKKVYRLLRKYISQNGTPPTYQAFLLKFLFLEGLMPQLFRCVSCGSTSISAFSVERGGVVCKRCMSEKDISWSREASVEFRDLTKEPLEKLKGRKFKWLSRIEVAAERHLRYRVER